jgi:hypothetical protein
LMIMWKEMRKNQYDTTCVLQFWLTERKKKGALQTSKGALIGGVIFVTWQCIFCKNIRKNIAGGPEFIFHNKHTRLQHKIYLTKF